MRLELPANIDPRKQLLELDRFECEESLYFFFRSAWPQIDSDPWVDGWCMEAMAEHLEAVRSGEITRLLCNISPRCSKSNLFSVAFPAWVWTQSEIGPISGPRVKFVGASYASQLSLRDNVKCRRLIESDWYQARWGDRFKLTSDQNTKSRFTNDQGGERLITSIDGTNTGEGGMCFVAGTRISTPRGNVKIEDLRIGDAVLAFDRLRGKVVKSSVVATAKRTARDLCTLYEVSGHRVTCTQDHPIYSPGRGFVPAGEMGPGDRLLISNGYRQAREFDYALRKVPSSTPSWENSYVAKVSHDCGEAVSVYDIQVERQSNFFAEGILAHNCIIIDDPNSVDDVDSEATIQTAIDWWEGTMPTRLNNQKTGAYVIIQQRTFENDLTGHILETEADDWVHLMIPMRYEPERSYITTIGWKDPRTEPGELMWPERFGEREVRRLEKRLGPFRSAGQLQQRPEPAGGGIIERLWWQLWTADAYPPMDYVIGLLDTAYTEEKYNDPSAMVILGVFTPSRQLANANSERIRDAQGNTQWVRQHTDRYQGDASPRVMLLYAWREWLKLHDLVNKVKKTATQFKIDLLKIENKASGISTSQEIQRLFRDEKFGVQLYDPKSQDKTARLISVQHLFAEELVYAPDRQWAEMVIQEVCQYPKSKHKDLTDCVSMGMRHLRETGLLSREVEIEIENDAMKTYPGNREQSLYPV